MARATNRPELAVTERHRLAAFEAMAWAGWTYEQAMADTVRSRIVHLRARQLCNAEARVMRRQVVPAEPQRLQAYLQRPEVRGTGYPYGATTDMKRAAAGDRDD